MKIITPILLFFVAFQALSQSTYIERTSPNPASAQIFFHDRSSNGNTDRHWKIATLPTSSAGTGDKIMIELFGGSHGASSTFQQVIHMGNRGAFKGYLRTSYGEPYSSVRIRAFEQSDGSVDVFFTLLSNGWKGGSVRVYEGSGITSTRPTIYENPQDVGPTPGGVLVFDSWTSIPAISARNTGNIGIGTSSPDEKLTVKGTVHAEEVKVDLSVPGPDYVFEEDYNLRSLEETEAYIKENKHLPEIPSAKEMEANGVQLGEMNMLLLKKIEELTLYQIELLKKLEEQSERIDNQQKEIEKLNDQ